MKQIKIKIDLEKIAETDAIDYDNQPEDKFPILSCLHIYDEVGLVKIAEKYADAKKDLEGQEKRSSISVIDHFFCNADTKEKMRKYIKENWERYNLDIKKDNEVIWKPNKSRRRNVFLRNLGPTLTNCINYDFLNYGPGTTDIEDDVIIFFWEEDEIVLDPEKEYIVTEKPTFLQTLDFITKGNEDK